MICNIIKSYHYAFLFFVALIGWQLTFAGKIIDPSMHARIMGMVTSMTSAKYKQKCVDDIRKELSDIELTSENYNALNNLSEAVRALPVVKGSSETLINATFDLKKDECLVSAAQQEVFKQEMELITSLLVGKIKKIYKIKKVKTSKLE